MRRIMKIMLCLVLIAGLLYAPVTIPELADTNAVATAEAATVKINKKKATIYKGTSVQLKIQGTKKKVSWSSSNKKIASVTKKGKVTGKKAGTATIKAKVNGKVYKSKVIVKNVPKMSRSKITITKGKKWQLSVKGYKIGTVKWSSSNKKVASVTKKGKVTAKKPGTAKIRAKVGGKTLTCIVTVRNVKQPPEKPKETYTITYILNNGTNAPENPVAYTEGDSFRLADPVYENHAFKGWYTDKACTQLFEQITSETKGDLTLYAKWHLAALNIQGEGLEDMIWSWWYYPQVVSDNSDGTKVHWGYATKDGYCGVAQYDKKTGAIKKTILKKAAADDHNGLALTLLQDKRIMCVYAGGHNTDNEMHIRISDKPLDISSFSEEIVLESAGKTCYGQIIRSSGKYYLFYRVNNNSWAYRYSTDGRQWSRETVIMKAPMQYYCKVVPTTTDGMIRILMYSNPAQSAPEIRMGFLDTRENAIYNSDGTTRMQDSTNYYDTFQVIQNAESGKKHRLFDAAVTDVDKPRFLFASFTRKSNVNDAVYYLHDAGRNYEICKGGRYLMDANYQLGAAFVDKNTIVAGRNSLGTDYIELYNFDGDVVSRVKTIGEQTGTGFVRNARPIVDINGRAVLWHNGYYNYKSYQKFDTKGQLYLLDDNMLIADQAGGLDGNDLGRVKKENTAAAEKFISALYSENKDVEPLKGDFSWQLAEGKPSWIYYTGLVHEGLLMTDPELYRAEVQEFYTAHIKDDGSIRNYAGGTLDAALPAVNMLSLLYSGQLTYDESAQYKKAVNYVYNQLEKQTVYTDSGYLMQHSQDADGNPRAGWDKWNICLDGIYMSQLFYIRLAEAIDDGIITVTDRDGAVVSGNMIWNDVYKRMIFVMQKMKSNNTGLPFHGYCVAEKTANNAFWSRGIGWYSMVLMEAAEKMPNRDKREILVKYYNNLMTAVVSYQDPETFLWYNVPDAKEELTLTKEGTLIENRPESSGSSMLAYCLLRGYHEGLLADEEYYKAGLRAYNSLVETKLTAEGLTDICFSSAVHSNPAMYMHSGYVVNDGKGVGPFIMATKYVY